jgi:hypothetical protein
MPSKSTPTLTVEQSEIAAQFSDYAFDYPRLNFSQVARKARGPKPFPNTPNGRAFRREAKSMFDLKREK